MIADPTAAPDRSVSVQLDPTAQPPVILLDRDAAWGVIREEARAVLEPVSAAWAGAEAVLDLGERQPDLFDLRRLVHVLKDDFDISIIGMRCRDEALKRFAERELKVRIHLVGPPPPVDDDEHAEASSIPTATEATTTSEEPRPDPTIETEPDTASELLGASGLPLRVVQRTLRGGKILRHSGDLLLYGDVNPGAQVIAGGSITVLGALKGMAHAGTRSGDRGWILATSMDPTQLRIGQRITIPESSQTGDRGPRGPELATVQEGEIFIEPYRGRLPRNASRRSDA
jgi:septum site-determining protein MinC